MTEPRAGSKVAVPMGAPQERLEAEERRRNVVLLLLGLAVVILVFWPGVFSLVPGPRSPCRRRRLRGLRVGMWL